MFQRTKAINKLLSLKKKKRVVQGGTWAGKTYSIVSVLINEALTSKKRILVAAETIPSVKGGPLNDFKNIMKDVQRWDEDEYDITQRIYTYSNGSEIHFSAFDSVEKAQAAGKWDIIFINEAFSIPFDIAYALFIRTRDSIWIDYNPVKEFWAHTQVVPNQDAEFIILKYHDNDCLPESILNELKQNQEKAKTDPYWKNWCRVYIDGEIGSMEGAIFNNIKLIDEFPKHCTDITYGLDFGFTNSVTALVKVGFVKEDIYIEELLYMSGLVNSEISNHIKTLRIGNPIIIADNEPKSIEDLKRMGHTNIKEVGKKDVKAGIDYMQQRKIYIVSSSLNAIKEFRGYMWKKDNSKAGGFINEPVKVNDHCVDAARMVCEKRIIKPIMRGVPSVQSTFKRISI
jgi:phage terminase large subunit